MVKLFKCIGGCVRKQNSVLSYTETESSLDSSVVSESIHLINELNQEVNSTQTIVEEENSLQAFYEEMAYESVLEFLLTIVSSVFGAFDFVCRIVNLLWEIFRPISNLTNLEGKNVLIVGGGGGVGSAVAKQLAKLGANVAIWDNNEKRLKLVESELHESGYKVISRIVDIRSAKEVNSAGEELSKSFDVDILFNSAGVCHVNDSLDDTDDRIELVVDSNLKGVVWPTRFFWRKFLQKKKGHIAAMASVAGISGVPHLCEYTGTLHGVVGYLDALEADTFARGIHDIDFTVCNPPFIHTEMAHSLTTTGVPKYPWISADDCATEVVKAISARKRLHTYPWDAALFCSFKAILPRRRFNLLNGRWWMYN